MRFCVEGLCSKIADVNVRCAGLCAVRHTLGWTGLFLRSIFYYETSQDDKSQNKFVPGKALISQ